MTTPTIPQNDNATQNQAPPAVGCWPPFRDTLASIGVLVEGDADVRDYLDAHADTYGVAEVICRAVRAEFGPDARLTLRLYRDLEVPQDTYLQLRVTLPQRSPRTLARINALAEAHEDLRWDKSGHIVVTPFQPRRG
jgi:hypothetical protein